MEVVKAVICKNKKYLLQLRDDNSLITYPNTWSFFGGEVDENEGLLEALKVNFFVSILLLLIFIVSLPKFVT